MKSKIFLLICTLCIGVMVSVSITSCQKMERPPLILIPDDTAKLNGPLQRFWAFENTVMDSIQDAAGIAKDITYVDGVKGKAYKGSLTGQVEYPAAGRLATMASFTIAFWMNTGKHDGGAQSVFMLPRTSDFWGNMFMLIEGNNNPADNSMLVKFNFAGQWVQFDGGGTNPPRIPDMYGKWKHMAFTYDSATSKFAAYVDGAALALPAAITDRKKESPAGSGTFVPMGGLQFVDVSKFIIGGYQQHLGSPWAAPDGWMLHYTGMLDQFRIYTKMLTATEINQLYTSKQ
jgi:hypothetical protein